MAGQNKAEAAKENELGNACARARRFDEAATHYRKAIRLDTAFAPALNNLGNIYREKGDLKAAAAQFERAVGLSPSFAMAHNNLGIVLQSLGQTDEAEVRHRRALALAPDYAEAWFNLGNVLTSRAQAKEAEACYLKAVEIQSGYAEAWLNLANLLRDVGRSEDAVVCYQKACLAKPTFGEAYYNLGAHWLMENKVEAALPCLRKAAELLPQHADVWINFGNALAQIGEKSTALAAFERAILLQPSDYKARVNRALLLLGMGQFDDGWKEYEARWQVPAMAAGMPNDAPSWEGQNLAGAQLRLECEQGFGDSLQFVRYATLAAEKGARVTLVCPEALRRLFERVEGVERVVGESEALPPCDFHAPLMSLPRLLGTRLDTVPSKVPYLMADGEDSARMRAKMKSFTGLRVGLVWAGQARMHDAEALATDQRRSMSFESLRPLLAVRDDVTFFSLQKGEKAAQTAQALGATPLVDWMDGVADFADTAAIIDNLDLVIGVDTSVIHLAGAMGKKVWVMSRFDGCWRWLEKREDSPWYPTLRLFRQAKAGDWDGVVAHIATALKAF